MILSDSLRIDTSIFTDDAGYDYMKLWHAGKRKNTGNKRQEPRRKSSRHSGNRRWFLSSNRSWACCLLCLRLRCDKPLALNLHSLLTGSCGFWPFWYTAKNHREICYDKACKTAVAARCKVNSQFNPLDYTSPKLNKL